MKKQIHLLFSFLIVSFFSHSMDVGKKRLQQLTQEKRKQLCKLLKIEDITAINTKDEKGNTLLYYAAHDGHQERTDFLLRLGANPNGIADDEDATIAKLTPLHVAALKGEQRIVELLLEAGATVDIKDSNGVTPLYLAQKTGNQGIADLLSQ